MSFQKTRKEEKQFTFSTALPFFSVGIAAGLFVGLTNFWSEDVKILHFAKMYLFQVRYAKFRYIAKIDISNRANFRGEYLSNKS